MTAPALLASILLALGAPEPGTPVTPPSGPAIAAGDPAPDFQYQAADYRWTRLADVLARASVLLVIGAGEAELRQLQLERDAMLARGVAPIAVVDLADGPAWSVAQRLGITFSMLSDPRRDIATAYRLPDSGTGHPRPAWFAIDREGRVRARGSEIAGIASFDRLACEALAPATDTELTAVTK